jgi:hypothetical protein
MRNVVFWDIKPWSCRYNRRFGRTYRLHISVKTISELGTTFTVTRNAAAMATVTDDVAPSSLFIFILMMEAILVSEMWVLTSVTRRHIPENGILHSVYLVKRGSHFTIFCFCSNQNEINYEYIKCALNFPTGIHFEQSPLLYRLHRLRQIL